MNSKGRLSWAVVKTVDSSDIDGLYKAFSKACLEAKMPVPKPVEKEFKKRMENSSKTEKKSKLDFAKCGITDEYLHHLLNGLDELPVISKLTLNSNPISQLGADEIMKLMKSQIESAQSIPLDRRLNMVFLGHVDLQYTTFPIAVSTLNRIKFYAEILQYLNIQTRIRSMFLHLAINDPIPIQSINAYWTTLFGPPPSKTRDYFTRKTAELSKAQILAIPYADLEKQFMFCLAELGEVVTLTDEHLAELVPASSKTLSVRKSSKKVVKKQKEEVSRDSEDSDFDAEEEEEVVVAPKKVSTLVSKAKSAKGSKKSAGKTSSERDERDDDLPTIPPPPVAPPVYEEVISPRERKVKSVKLVDTPEVIPSPVVVPLTPPPPPTHSYLESPQPSPPFSQEVPLRISSPAFSPPVSLAASPIVSKRTSPKKGTKKIVQKEEDGDEELISPVRDYDSNNVFDSPAFHPALLPESPLASSKVSVAESPKTQLKNMSLKTNSVATPKDDEVAAKMDSMATVKHPVNDLSEASPRVSPKVLREEKPMDAPKLSTSREEPLSSQASLNLAPQFNAETETSTNGVKVFEESRTVAVAPVVHDASTTMSPIMSPKEGSVNNSPAGVGAKKSVELSRELRKKNDELELEVLRLNQVIKEISISQIEREEEREEAEEKEDESEGGVGLDAKKVKRLKEEVKALHLEKRRMKQRYLGLRSRYEKLLQVVNTMEVEKANLLISNRVDTSVSMLAPESRLLSDDDMVEF